jgi:hypothetical protein
MGSVRTPDRYRNRTTLSPGAIRAREGPVACPPGVARSAWRTGGDEAGRPPRPRRNNVAASAVVYQRTPTHGWKLADWVSVGQCTCRHFSQLARTVPVAWSGAADRWWNVAPAPGHHSSTTTARWPWPPDSPVQCVAQFVTEPAARPRVTTREYVPASCEPRQTGATRSGANAQRLVRAH